MCFICGEKGCRRVSKEESEKICPPRKVKYPNFSKIIREARKAKKITQGEMAEAIGVDWVQYSRWDNGYEFPDVESLIKINKILFGG